MAGPKKRSDVTVDFTDVESGGRSVPDDNYLLEVVSVEEKESQEGNQYLAWKWKVAEGTYKGVTVYDNTSLKPTALWRLKGLLEAMGEEVNGKFGLNLGSYKGNKVMCVVANETYQGKQKPRITDFLREAAPSAPAASSKGPKKGAKVTFEYEGEEMSGIVASASGDVVVVEVEVNGSKEEWELAASDITLS